MMFAEFPEEVATGKRAGNEVAMFHLASEQIYVGAIPAAQFRVATLILLVSDPRYADHGRRIKNFLEERGLSCETESISVGAYDPDSVSDAICTSVRETRAKGCSTEFVVNLTGGTKLMAIGAYKAAESLGLACVYMDTDNQKLRIIRGNLTAPGWSEITQGVGVAELVQLYGGSVTRSRTSSVGTDSELTHVSWEIAESWRNSRGLWKTWFAQIVQKAVSPSDGRWIGGLTRTIEVDNKFVDDVEFIVNRLRLQRLVSSSHSVRGAGRTELTIEFPSAQVADFFTRRGLWLEVCAYEVLRGEIKKHMRADPSIELGCEVSLGEVSNEFDVVAAVDGLLFVVSCKSGKVDQAALTSMDGVSRIGGSHVRRALVAAEPLTYRIHKRAELMGILLVQLDDLLKWRIDPEVYRLFV